MPRSPRAFFARGFDERVEAADGWRDTYVVPDSDACRRSSSSATAIAAGDKTPFSTKHSNSRSAPQDASGSAAPVGAEPSTRGAIRDDFLPAPAAAPSVAESPAAAVAESPAAAVAAPQSSSLSSSLYPSSISCLSVGAGLPINLDSVCAISFNLGRTFGPRQTNVSLGLQISRQFAQRDDTRQHARHTRRHATRDDTRDTRRHATRATTQRVTDTLDFSSISNSNSFSFPPSTVDNTKEFSYTLDSAHASRAKEFSYTGTEGGARARTMKRRRPSCP